MYYIYHIPGVKIGCTIELDRRIKKQGFEEHEILEIHTDIYEASDRELELQREYGYLVDTVPYYVSVEHIKKGRLKGAGFKPGDTHMIQGQNKLKRKLTFAQAQEIRAKYKWRVYTVRMLSEEYNVGMSSITKILKNQYYTEE